MLRVLLLRGGGEPCYRDHLAAQEVHEGVAGAGQAVRGVFYPDAWDVSSASEYAATEEAAVHATIEEVEEVQGHNTAKAVRTPIYWVLLLFCFHPVYYSTLGKYIVCILALVGSPSQPLSA